MQNKAVHGGASRLQLLLVSELLYIPLCRWGVSLGAQALEAVRRSVLFYDAESAGDAQASQILHCEPAFSALHRSRIHLRLFLQDALLEANVRIYKVEEKKESVSKKSQRMSYC